MVDRIQKVLNKLSDKEKSVLLSIMKDILSGNVSNYDIKKLKGHEGIYRLRKGKLRIIYSLERGEQASILAIERRSDTTYNF